MNAGLFRVSYVLLARGGRDSAWVPFGINNVQCAEKAAQPRACASPAVCPSRYTTLLREK
jgi:hypothetical protein